MYTGGFCKTNRLAVLISCYFECYYLLYSVCNHVYKFTLTEADTTILIEAESDASTSTEDVLSETFLPEAASYETEIINSPYDSQDQ